MKKIKKGDIVSRISYDNDILFTVDMVLPTVKGKIVILKGLIIRITADAPINDLKIANKNEIRNSIEMLDNRIADRAKNKEEPLRKTIRYGKILHLDGDKKYSEKSAKYYKSLGLNAIVKNISENRQPYMMKNLLNKYSPDIVVITGHDGMIKNGTGFQDMYNYRNSRYFVKSVLLAREWEKENYRLAIFAGACQSYYEALINAGANFASSPARILIDFIDPLIVAERIAITDENRFLTIKDIEKDLRDGQKGVSGVGSKGTKKYL